MRINKVLVSIFLGAALVGLMTGCVQVLGADALIEAMAKDNATFIFESKDVIIVRTNQPNTAIQVGQARIVHGATNAPAPVE